MFKNTIFLFVSLVISLNFKLNAKPTSVGLQIEKIVAAGSGCPVRELLAEEDYFILEERWLIIKQDENFTAQVGEGIPLSASRKNCQYNIRLSGDKQYKASIEKVYALYEFIVPEDDSASIAIHTSLQGSSDVSKSERELVGSAEIQRKFLEHRLDPVYSECDHSRSLNLNSMIKLSPTKTGSEIVKSISQKGYLFIKLSTQTCEDDIVL